MRTIQYIAILIAFLFIQNLTAQQAPFLNQYTWNPRLFNPASQGFDKMGEITAVYRSQFQDLEASVRPNTYLFHADFSPWFSERIGLAAQIMGDKAHILSRFQAGGFFAYHLIQNSKIRFSLGVSAGILSQNLDFEGLRLSDILDLSVFYGQMKSTQFDGGPGLAFEYRLAGGSFFAFDAAATQLFSSDITIDGPNDTSQDGGIYDMIPHFLANARFRYQGDGFAVEPNVAFRALSGMRTLKYGLFDFNLNTYFFEDDRLMLGAGLRTDKGGVHFQLGVAPTSYLRLIASVELHSNLGPSYELGVNYTFAKTAPQPTNPPIAVGSDKNLIEDIENEIRVLVAQFEDQSENLQALQNTSNTAILAGTASSNRANKTVSADSCSAQLERGNLQLERLRQTASAIETKRLLAKQKVHRITNQGASNSLATSASLQKIEEYSATVNSQVRAFATTQSSLGQQCANLLPANDAYACISKGDADCLQTLFSSALNTVSGKPDNLYPLRTFAVPGSAAITYHYPDDAESYLLPVDQRTLADHLIAKIRQVEQQGLALDHLSLVTELQEDEYTLGYRLGTLYGGELGDAPTEYALIDNETGATRNQTLVVFADSPISLEVLGVLKLLALKKYFTEAGISAGKISLQIRYNHSANIYREETKLVLRLRT